MRASVLTLECFHNIINIVEHSWGSCSRRMCVRVCKYLFAYIIIELAYILQHIHRTRTGDVVHFHNPEKLVSRKSMDHGPNRQRRANLRTLAHAPTNQIVRGAA